MTIYFDSPIYSAHQHPLLALDEGHTVEALVGLDGLDQRVIVAAEISAIRAIYQQYQKYY